MNVNVLTLDLVRDQHLPVLDTLVVAIDTHEQAEVIQLLKHVPFEVAAVYRQDLVLGGVVFNIKHEIGVLSHLIIGSQSSNSDVECQHFDCGFGILRQWPACRSRSWIDD